MITLVDNKHVEEYAVLFHDAFEALSKAGKQIIEVDENGLETPRNIEETDIDNLAEYFHFMHDLAVIDGQTKSLKFTMLPLDEEVFEINNNTRTIKVPDSFQKNGVSVCGDEIAEIVYFCVDRYYDTTDLNEQQIIIEWINASGQKGFSRPYGQDTDLIPGKIIFGWPLSSKITERDGTITFAVRFYDAENTQTTSGITYSLSTLTQTVKVNKTIDIKLEDILDKKAEIFVDDSSDIVIARTKNSKDYNSAAVGEPVIVWTSGVEDYVYIDNKNNVVRVAYIDPESENDAIMGKPYAEVTACVYADGPGITTSSFWQKFRYVPTGDKQMDRELVRKIWETGNVNEQEAYAQGDKNFLDEYSSYVKYTALKASAAQAEMNARAKNSNNKPVAGIIYYLDNGEGGYVPLKSDDLLAMVGEDTVYRQDYAVHLTDIGVYQFQAEVTGGTAKATALSEYIIVFPPVAPKNVVITGDSLLAEDEEDPELFKAALAADCDVFDNAVDVVPPAFVEYTAEKYPFNGEKYERPQLTYQWYVCDADGENLSAQVSANTANLVVGDEGYFICGITGHLNNHDTTEQLSAPFRVTMPADKFKATIAGTDAQGEEISYVTAPELADSTVLALGQSIEKITVNAVTNHTPAGAETQKYNDMYEYHWYRYVPNANENDYTLYKTEGISDAVLAMQGKYVPQLTSDLETRADSDSPDWGVPEEYVNTSELVPTRDGIYFCMITNIYNGDKKVMCSPFIAFDFNEKNAQ